MKHRLGIIVILYGVFLVCCGLFGYLLTQETSSSSLLNGVVFGTLMVIMGILLHNGRPWTLPASLSATAIFALTFLWRGGLQWSYLFKSENGRLSIALLLTLMFLVSLGVVILLVNRLRR